MNDFIVGFSKPNRWKPFAWLIQLVDRTEYDHVYIKWYSPSIDRWMVYQASGTAVNFEGTTHFLSHSIPIEEYQLQVSDNTKKSVIQYAVDNCGVPYGVKQVLGIGIVKVAKLIGKNIKNPFSDGSKTEVCAELVGRILEDCLGDKLNIDLDSADPTQINVAVQSIPGVQRVL